MKKRILALALALCMVFTMSVTASAVEEDTEPQIADMDIAYNGTDISRSNVNGSLVFTAEGDKKETQICLHITQP